MQLCKLLLDTKLKMLAPQSNILHKFNQNVWNVQDVDIRKLATNQEFIKGPNM